VQRLLQFQISVVYFFAALHKMTDQYLDGHVLAHIMAPVILNGKVGQLLGGWLSAGAMQGLQASVVRPEFWVIPAWGTVLLEASLPFALWIPRVRVGAMLFGIPFHLMIAYTMTIETFSTAMIASYLLFLDPATLPRLWRQVRERMPGDRSRRGGRNRSSARRGDAVATGKGRGRRR